jgi:hypothetical protein
VCPFCERGRGGRSEVPYGGGFVLRYERDGGGEVGAPIYEADAEGEDRGEGKGGGLEEGLGGSEVGGERGDVCSGADEAYAAYGESVSLYRSKVLMC